MFLSLVYIQNDCIEVKKSIPGFEQRTLVGSLDWRFLIEELDHKLTSILVPNWNTLLEGTSQADHQQQTSSSSLECLRHFTNTVMHPVQTAW